MARTDDLVARILKTMAIFTEAAFLTLEPDEIDRDETLRRATLVFLFGALDAVIHQYSFDADQKIAILDAYLEQTFPAYDGEERDETITFLCDASQHTVWVAFMQRGGQAMCDWARGESRASMMLGHLLHFGIDDADMIRATRKP